MAHSHPRDLGRTQGRGYAPRVFPALPSWLRKPSPRTVDITVTVVVALLIVPGTVIDAAHHGKGLAAAVFTVAAVVPLLWRRRAPFVTLALITAATVLTPVDGPVAIPLMVSLYTMCSTDLYIRLCSAGIIHDWRIF